MPLFTRRRLAGFIEELSLIYGARGTAEITRKLARLSDQTVPAEWELFVGSVLLKAGGLQRPDDATSKNPDFIWSPSGQNQEFSVEVTCLSDLSIENQNPIRQFTEHLRRLHKKFRLNSGSFQFAIGEGMVDGNRTLALPPGKELVAFFKGADFLEFIATVRNSPNDRHRFEFFTPNGGSAIEYVPGDSGSLSGSYGAVASSEKAIDRIISNRLSSKADQIRGSAYSLPSIVFLCDNGFNAFRYDSFSHVNIVLEKSILSFIANGSTQIDSVVVLSVSDSGLFAHERRYRNFARIFTAPRACEYLRSDSFSSDLKKGLAQAPDPFRMPINASNAYPEVKHNGGYSFGGSKLKLPALYIQHLLSGDISWKEFKDDYPEVVAFIQNSTKAGRMISNARIVACPDKDDDWIELEFEGTNPAAQFENKAR